MYYFSWLLIICDDENHIFTYVRNVVETCSRDRLIFFQYAGGLIAGFFSALMWLSVSVYISHVSPKG